MAPLALALGSAGILLFLVVMLTIENVTLSRANAQFRLYNARLEAFNRFLTCSTEVDDIGKNANYSYGYKSDPHEQEPVYESHHLRAEEGRFSPPHRA
jgi:hypothetical protein